MPEEKPPAESSERGTGSSLERLVSQLKRGHPNGEATPTPQEEEDLAAHVLELSEKYSGIFPHPAVLRQLNEIFPDGAERAFALTEREQEHRHRCDEKLLDADIQVKEADIRIKDAEIRRIDREATDRRLTLILAFLFIFAGLVCSVALALAGQAAGASITGAGTSVVTAVLGIFAIRNRPSS